MDTGTIIPIAVIVVALGTLVYLTFWSRRTINRIADSSGRSAREIQREVLDE